MPRPVVAAAHRRLARKHLTLTLTIREQGWLLKQLYHDDDPSHSSAKTDLHRKRISILPLCSANRRHARTQPPRKTVPPLQPRILVSCPPRRPWPGAAIPLAHHRPRGDQGANKLLLTSSSTCAGLGQKLFCCAGRIVCTLRMAAKQSIQDGLPGSVDLCCQATGGHRLSRSQPRRPTVPRCEEQTGESWPFRTPS